MLCWVVSFLSLLAERFGLAMTHRTMGVDSKQNIVFNEPFLSVYSYL